MFGLLQPDSIKTALRDSLARDSIAIADSSNALQEALMRAKESETVEAVSSVFDSVLGGLHDATGFSKAFLINFLVTAVVLAIIWSVRFLVLRLAYRRTYDIRARYQWRKTSTYVAAFLTVFALFRIWIGAIGSLATFFGLLSAGLAIALKDPLANFAGWLFIVWRRPFAAGDRIMVRTHTGDVIDQRVFMFTLLEVGTETGAGQSTGRIVHVPNGWMFTDSIINFTRGFPYIWNEIAVLVTFESNWRAAKQILFDISAEHVNHLSEDAERKLRRAAQEYLIFYQKLTPTVYTSVKESGVELTMRYLVEPRRTRGSEQQIWEVMLDAFAARDDIDFAYPTQRFFQNTAEGKPGTRPDAQFAGEAAEPAPEPPPIKRDTI